MASGQVAVGFNRVAQGLLGATGFSSLMVTIPNTVSKELNSVHLSAAAGSSPYVIADYQIRVLICDQQGKFPDLGGVIPFAAWNVSGTDDIGDVGSVYYDQVITLPYNNPIIFDEPILFTGSTRIFVMCSIPYANADTILTVPNRYVRMSVNGRLLDSPALQYKQR